MSDFWCWCEVREVWSRSQMLDTRKYRFVDDLIWIYQSQTDENFCSIDHRGTEERMKSCENFINEF